MAEHRGADDFSPPPFSFALMGHLATGMVKAAVIALLLWGLGLTGWTASLSAGSALVTLERPWADGDTQADIRSKHEETRAMTREQFRSE